ncbi:helix-turn-helix transcriptional regulator [Cytophaga sp. FL35]|uniref:helix-turn-helix domain-containing protein n=1 Tax=Cytophaga sp. FL35 TaxID=1904456 RepID=UPI00165356FE|nr:helix-turn-helix transcriptional regulator [Cytophaga sp. FL35]MBC6997413.1 helix-turn-helix transcriptional regulator [Cytophaga sp. FL35]
MKKKNPKIVLSYLFLRNYINMKPIKRVELIIQYFKTNISAFEKRCDLSNNSIGAALRRNTSLKDDTLNKILDSYPQINPIWLLTGNGDMLVNKNTPEGFNSLKKSSICDRVRMIYDFKGFQQYSQFSKVTGILEQTVSNYLKGKQKPDAEKMEIIIRAFPEIDERWFLTGQGEMLKSKDKKISDLSITSDSEIIEHIAQNLERFKSLATFRRVVGLKD